MVRGKRKLGFKSEMPLESDVPVTPPESPAKPAWELWAESVDLSVEAVEARRASREPRKSNGFRDKATKAFEQKLASAVPARAWPSVWHAFNQYGTYLELIA